MPMLRCNIHDIFFDGDYHCECPLCESEERQPCPPMSSYPPSSPPLSTSPAEVTDGKICTSEPISRPSGARSSSPPTVARSHGRVSLGSYRQQMIDAGRGDLLGGRD